MMTFKEYMLEYATKDKSLFFGVSKIKHGSNGKSYDNANSRKHINTAPKQYKHKHPLVDSICTNKTNNVRLQGQPLLNILSLYNTRFLPGETSVLGNSGVEVSDMSENEEGVPCATLRKRTNGV